ncbi:MAG: M42 family peptidase [Erysipelotrichaceae bacterium]|nr:M42 family peptidase [Erysipelotrichaceae bacterium]
MLKKIMDLADLIGVSSQEQRVASYLINHIPAAKYDINTDNLGNLVVSSKLNRPDQRNVLLFAHMDEIGLIIRQINDKGFLYFERLGGVNTQILPGTRFKLDGMKGFVKGVIGVQAHHFMSPEHKMIIPALSELYLDIGASSKDEVLASGIDVGSLAAFDACCEIKADKYLCGKALDNRMAVGVLLELIENLADQLFSFNLFFCFPVMEEFNIRGLMPVIRKIKPDISIGIDITPACDTPDLHYNDIKLNSGPAITCMNFHGGGTLAGVLPDQDLFRMIVTEAANQQITLQKEVAPGVITENAFALFENENGIKVANLSIPTRYTHTPFETAAISDIQNLYQVLERVLKRGLGDLMGKGGFR